MKLSTGYTIFSFLFQLFGCQFHFGRIHIQRTRFQNLFVAHILNGFGIQHNDHHMYRIGYHIISETSFKNKLMYNFIWAK